MAKASDNPFPSLLFVETAAPASPASGDQRLFIDPSDHLLKYKNSAGTITAVGGGGGSTITPATTEITTSETRNLNSFGDLTTVGPTVTVTIGASGLALVHWACEADVSGAAVGIDISGATTLAPAATDILYWGSGPFDIGTSKLYTGLTAGSTTFKMKYRSFNATTVTFANRRLVVIPF